MSKTDKTNPYWVKIAQREGNVRPWREYHRHHWDYWDGVCTLRNPLPRVRDATFHACEVWNRDEDNGKIFGRRPKRSTRKAMGRSRRHRADLVRLRRLWLWQDREDIDSLENAPINHRYLYDPWDWD